MPLESSTPKRPDEPETLFRFGEYGNKTVHKRGVNHSIFGRVRRLVLESRRDSTTTIGGF